ncbi:MAG: hypothetical protein C0602_01370 [Denitrovibrio sp.]|nr:MAG: hypothetical protein C0602_01370 [Denitrovibrio sp.]
MEIKEKNILIVEYDLLSNKLMKKILEDEGYTVYSALDGEEGFVKFLEYDPDIVITNLRMPVLCGCELVDKIRETHQNVPVLFCTGEYVDGVNELLLIKKPIDVNVLKEKILKALIQGSRLNTQQVSNFCKSKNDSKEVLLTESSL